MLETLYFLSLAAFVVMMLALFGFLIGWWLPAVVLALYVAAIAPSVARYLATFRRP